MVSRVSSISILVARINRLIDEYKRGRPYMVLLVGRKTLLWVTGKRVWYRVLNFVGVCLFFKSDVSSPPVRV